MACNKLDILSTRVFNCELEAFFCVGLSNLQQLNLVKRSNKLFRNTLYDWYNHVGLIRKL